MAPTAKVIADSVSPGGHRLTTLEVVIHRFVLSELNTHRVFSRNSASSRAIPVRKQLDRVQHNPATPVVWPAEQKGMQGGDPLSERDVDRAEEIWAYAGQAASNYVRELVELGVHKSVTNRLLEPFMWHTVVITATAWGNFFALRCNPMAQPEIRVAAEAMKAAMDASTPVQLEAGQWHLPYIQTEDWLHDRDEDLIKASAARCARVSYLTQDGVRDIGKDIELYERLISAVPMHASPLEHVATPAPENAHRVYPGAQRSPVSHVRGIELPVYGNLLGWHAHRFDVEAQRGYTAFA